MTRHLLFSEFLIRQEEIGQEIGEKALTKVTRAYPRTTTSGADDTRQWLRAGSLARTAIFPLSRRTGIYGEGIAKLAMLLEINI
jgi:hypothetical protein